MFTCESVTYNIAFFKVISLGEDNSNQQVSNKTNTQF